MRAAQRLGASQPRKRCRSDDGCFSDGNHSRKLGLLLALEKTTRLHRGATGYAAVSDHCDALVAKATAKQALKLFLDTAEGRAARGEARPALQAAARDLLFSTGLFAPDGTPLSAAAAKNALCTYVDHAPATPAQRR
mmetsp:Transcript_12688/g.43828  ORF Transcript_12688/g.43828 Transcript_12688/m.43828 type:complete len:137 (-) Transcript_12688:66-476(-)